MFVVPGTFKDFWLPVPCVNKGKPEVGIRAVYVMLSQYYNITQNDKKNLRRMVFCFTTTFLFDFYNFSREIKLFLKY